MARALRVSIHATASGELSASSRADSGFIRPALPASEARRLAAAGLESAADAALLLGFGLGYLAEACLDAGSNRSSYARPTPIS